MDESSRFAGTEDGDQLGVCCKRSCKFLSITEYDEWARPNSWQSDMRKSHRPLTEQPAKPSPTKNSNIGVVYRTHALGIPIDTIQSAIQTKSHIYRSSALPTASLLYMWCLMVYQDQMHSRASVRLGHCQILGRLLFGNQTLVQTEMERSL